MAIFEDMVESINSKSFQARLLILAVIIAVLAGAFYYFLLEPKRSEIKSLQTTLQKREKLRNEYENIARELPKFEAENKRLQNEFKQSAKKLPVKKERTT